MRKKSDWQKIYNALVAKAKSTNFKDEAQSFLEMANKVKAEHLKPSKLEPSKKTLFGRPIFYTDEEFINVSDITSLIKAWEKAKKEGSNFEGPLGGPYRFYKE